MIPKAYIRAWSQHVPWTNEEQVEQDLVICRAVAEIFSQDWLAGSLAFRGGTALHKLYLQPQPRYSEDIDLVQVRAEPIKETVQRLQAALDFLGNTTVKPKRDGTQIICRFDSEFAPSMRLRLKVEANTREHFSVLGWAHVPFEVESAWYAARCAVTTYPLEELLGTKLRALYQRRKGRDLFDLYFALQAVPTLHLDALLHSYREYMTFSVGAAPTAREFSLNLEAKMRDTEFIGDTQALIRPQVSYDPQAAFEWIHSTLIERM